MENKYGVDVPYFTTSLKVLLSDLWIIKPTELRRCLLRLADVALPPVKPQKSVKRRKTVRRKLPAQQLMVAIANYLDREICSDVSKALKLSNGVLKIVRQHETV